MSTILTSIDQKSSGSFPKKLVSKVMGPNDVYVYPRIKEY